MTWDAYNRRKTTLRELLAIADTDRDRTLADLLDTVDPEHEVFENETAALFELQMLWLQRLTGHIDRLSFDGDEPADLVAITGWAAAAADLPGARALLDAHADAPELAKARRKERTFLAFSAGVHDVETIVETAREKAAHDDARTCQRQGLGLMARLRSVMAA